MVRRLRVRFVVTRDLPWWVCNYDVADTPRRTLSFLAYKSRFLKNIDAYIVIYINK